jgi:hypothetical protein
MAETSRNTTCKTASTRISEPGGILTSLQIVLKHSMFGTAGFDPFAVENTWIDFGPTLRTSSRQKGNENYESKADFRVPHSASPVAEKSRPAS